MRKTNKKLLLSLSVLATPFVVENLTNENVASANTQYNLTQNVKAYETAQNAAKQAKTNKTYSTGTYYVYKEHNGMINISKTQGKPGSWINPTNNKPAATSQTVTQTVTTVAPVKTQPTTPAKSAPKNEQSAAVEPPKQTTKKSEYTLNNDVKVYNTAASAKTQKGSKSTYKSGTYFIFKEFNGMMNISRTVGRAGAWINPVDNKVLEVKKSAVSNTAQKPAEIVATPASTSVAPTTGTSQTKVVETVQQSNAKTTPVKDAEYILKSRTSVYNTSVDARNSINSTTTYDQGTYYVYKTYNGMVNISRTRGRAGAWINPAANTENGSKTSQPASTVKPTETMDNSTAAQKSVVYYKQDDARWGKKRFGAWTMSYSACVPTSLAMAISTLSTEVSPVDIASHLYNSGYYNRAGAGTASAGLPGVLSKYGLKYKTIKTKDALKDELAKGSLVYATVDGQPFVNAGHSHAMIVKGLDETGKSATVYNPLSRLGIKDYTLDTIWSKKSRVGANLSLGSAMIVIYK